MQPTRIELHNFTSYAGEIVDLSQVSLAALVGQNGAGKSSLLDALTWCLFGEGTKGRSLDNYVRRGEQEARVAVDFELHGQTYRVIRHRAAAKGKTLLELFQADSAGGWTPLSGRTIAETQAALEALLRMDYRTFTASSLILQGQADALTSDMTDQERKEVLARILGLDLWDKLQERAREAARGVRARAGALAEQADRAAEKAVRLPEVEARLKGEEGVLQAAEASVAAAAARLADLEGQLRQKPVLEQQTRDLQQQIESKVVDLQRVATDIDQVQEEISQQQEVLTRRGAVEASLPQAQRDHHAAYDELGRLMTEVADLEVTARTAAGAQQQLADVDQQLRTRQRELDQVKAETKQASESLTAQADLLHRADEIRRVATAAAETRAELEVLDAKAQQFTEVDALCRELDAKASTWDRDVDFDTAQVSAQLDQAREQAALLQNVPCNGTALQSQCQLLASARSAADKVASLEVQMTDLNSRQNPHIDAWQEAVRKREAIGYGADRHASLRRTLNTIQATANLLPALEAAEQRAVELRARLAVLNERVQGLTDDIAALQAKRQPLWTAVTEAEGVAPRLERARRQLEQERTQEASTRERVARLQQALEEATAAEEAARQRITALESRVTELKVRREQLQGETGDLQDRLAETGRALAVMETVAGDLAAAQSSLQTWRQEEAAAREAIGRLRQELSDLQADAREAEEIRARVTTAEHQALVYETLDQAAGKKSGVPALIVEAAVPQVESLANDLLGRMAGGRLAVRLDTQAETKAGTLQEVLRIMVLEQGAERPYVTFSGAERFMVDLALRIALSKFLAHRAGAEIQLLVLDEGIGAADPANRQAIVQALFEASKEFAKVLIISHLDEVKDAFPQRIEVYRTPEGSKVKIA